MSRCRRIAAFTVLSLLTLFCISWAQGQQSAPLSEENLRTLIQVGIAEGTIVSKLGESGVAFEVDAVVIDRLKQAGASAAVLEAVQKAGAEQKRPAGGPAITYQQVMTLLEVGISETEILNRLANSPTMFTLDVNQIAELKGKRASDRLIKAMQGQRGTPDQAKEISDLVLILDCSGSMGERTPDGQTKMEAAKEVLTDLVRKIPRALHVSLLIYGHDKQQGCEAVQVVRPLSKLDDAGKEELVRYINRLQPVAHTPIALALETAGKQLSRVQGAAGIVLITDGKEMCHGDPSGVAARLAENPNLQFGVHVVGLGLNAEERAAVEQIAEAGQGDYYDAQTTEQLAKVWDKVAPNLPVAQPAVVPEKSILTTLVVQPLTLDGFPKIANVRIVPAGRNPADSTIQVSDQLGKPMVVAAGKYDIWYTPEDGGRWALLIANLELEDGQKKTLESNRLVSAIAVKDPKNEGLKLERLIIAPAGRNPADSSVQRGERFDQPMMVTAGREYDVYFDPEGGSWVPIARNVQAVGGQLTVVGGN